MYNQKESKKHTHITDNCKPNIEWKIYLYNCMFLLEVLETFYKMYTVVQYKHNDKLHLK